MDYYDIIKQDISAFTGKTAKQIFTRFLIRKGTDKDSVRAALSRLEKECVLFCDNGKYIPFESAGLIKGKLRCNERGYGFLVPENAGIHDFFIPPDALNNAFDGDEVYVKPVRGKFGEGDRAEVVRIVKRADKLVGVYMAEESYGFVVPDNRGCLMDIYVSYRNAHGAVTGDKVCVKLLTFPNGRNPEGEITEIIGKQHDLGAEERAIVISHSIPNDFPAEVKNYVAKQNYAAPLTVKGREDFRSERIITVDGENAKDLDDAISLKTLEKGHFLLGVHIADVSYYVPDGSPVDREALRRGTSVYFPDNVIPMLPKELSNGVCSLSEGEDKYTLSCIMEVDEKGNVVDRRISEGVIRSCRRLTYTAVDAILNGDEEATLRNADILPLISDMRDLAEILIKKRGVRGSIDLDVKEAEISVDASGKISISPLNRTLSHRMIEEFMILANECVAEFMRYTELPFIYRVHEAPKDDKTEEFIDYLKRLGITVRWSANGVHPKDYAKLLDRLIGSPLYPLVNKVMLRSMSKARYSPENLGHFGLASDCYCHFTSPIRRYPDLIVHRALKHMINGQIGEWADGYSAKTDEIAKASSDCERRADEAEREVDELFKSRYMRERIGEEFEGIISGVTAFGVFVELENTVEGLIKLDTLPRGNYEFERSSFTLSSKKISFSLGEKVRVMVAGVDTAARKTEFIFIKKVR